jgi:GAF domain-containing protein
LVNVGHTINSAVNLDDALQTITQEGCKLMGAKMCALLLLDESREWLDLRASHGAGGPICRSPGWRSRTVSSARWCGAGSRPGRERSGSSRYQSVGVARREDGLVAERAAQFSRRCHRDAPACTDEAHGSRTRRFAVCRRWRTSRPLPSRRPDSTSDSWISRSTCARVKSCPHSGSGRQVAPKSGTRSP